MTEAEEIMSRTIKPLEIEGVAGGIDLLVDKSKHRVITLLEELPYSYFP